MQTLDIMLSLACRFLFMLDAHLYPGDDLDGLPSESRDIEIRTILHRRDLFWICYILDKEITFRTGRPPIINDRSCDLTFPKDYWRQVTAEVPRLPGDLRLSLIKSKAYEELYSPHALKKSDAEILKDIRELDDLLENWRQSLPPEYRPTLTFSQEAHRMPKGRGLTIPSLFLRLEYHHCMTTIHRASRRCKDWPDNHRLDEGLGSSLGLALEASRSLLSYLHFAEEVLIPNLFWYVSDSAQTSSQACSFHAYNRLVTQKLTPCFRPTRIVIFYPLSAKLTLFGNILLNPSSPTASSDLNILSNTVEYVKGMFHRASGFSDTQLLHLKRVTEFLTELVTLAKTAILQSRQTAG